MSWVAVGCSMRGKAGDSRGVTVEGMMWQLMGTGNYGAGRGKMDLVNFQTTQRLITAISLQRIEILCIVCQNSYKIE